MRSLFSRARGAELTRRHALVVSTLALSLLATTMLATCTPASHEKLKVVIFTPVPFDILDESIVGIKEGLAEAGYTADKIDLREVNAGGQMQLLGTFAREIVSSQPAVIVPVSTPATAAIVSVAPLTQNVVFSTVTDPSAAKVPATPKNITGVSDAVNYQANIDLLGELFPNARRVGTIYNPTDAAAVFGLEKIKPIFAAKGITLTVVSASTSNDAVSAARSLVRQVDVIYVGSDSNAAAAMPGLVAVARSAKIPVIASDAGSVRNGALAAVSVDYRELGKAGAQLIVQVLQSGRPAGEIPRVAFVGKTLILNAKSAQDLNFKFPATLIARKPQIIGAQSAP